jgi:hypothetical protein
MKKQEQAQQLSAPIINDFGYYVGIEAVYSLTAGRFYIVQLIQP